MSLFDLTWYILYGVHMPIGSQLHLYYQYGNNGCHVLTVDQKIYLVDYLLIFNVALCWKYYNWFMGCIVFPVIGVGMDIYPVSWLSCISTSWIIIIISLE